MSDGTYSVFGKLQTLLRESDMAASDFVAICAACGVKISAAAISRAAQAQSFTHELDELLRPMVTRLEVLVALAGPLRLSFKNAEHVKLLLDLLDAGHNITSAKLELKTKEST